MADPLAQVFEDRGQVPAAQAPEAYVLVLGSQQGGKTSLVQRIANHEEDSPPKPTIGLDYTPLRANSLGIGGGRYELAHVYELAGSSNLSELIQVPITPQRLPTATVVLVLDLSKPASVCSTAARWLTAVQRRAAECVDKIRARKTAPDGAPTADMLFQQLDARVRLGFTQRSGAAALVQLPGPAAGAGAGAGTDTAARTGPHAVWNPAVVSAVRSALGEHADWKFVAPAGGAAGNPLTSPTKGSSGGSSGAADGAANSLAGTTTLPLQLVVVGSKWDSIKNVDGPKRRVVLAALRYIGLCWGAAVVTASTSGKDKAATMPAVRQVLSSAMFGLPPRVGCVADTDAVQPLAIPAGADTLDAILGLLGTGGGANGPAPPRKTDVALPAVAVAAGAGGLAPGSFEGRLRHFEALLHAHFPPTGPEDTLAALFPAAAVAAAAVPSSAAKKGSSGKAGAGAAPPVVAAVTPGSVGGASGPTQGSGGRWVFTDRAAVEAPEPAIDALRASKYEEVVAAQAAAKQREKTAAAESSAKSGQSTPIK